MVRRARVLAAAALFMAALATRVPSAQGQGPLTGAPNAQNLRVGVEGADAGLPPAGHRETETRRFLLRVSVPSWSRWPIDKIRVRCAR